MTKAFVLSRWIQQTEEGMEQTTNAYELIEYHALDPKLSLRDGTDLNGSPVRPLDPNLGIVEVVDCSPGTIEAIEADPRFVVLEVFNE